MRCARREFAGADLLFGLQLLAPALRDRWPDDVKLSDIEPTREREIDREQMGLSACDLKIRPRPERAQTVCCAARIPKEVLMRILALAILAIGTVSIGPAAAQTYDPAYPVCLHVYGRGAVLVAEKWNVFERVSVMNVFRAPLI